MSTAELVQDVAVATAIAVVVSVGVTLLARRWLR